MDSLRERISPGQMQPGIRLEILIEREEAEKRRLSAKKVYEALNSLTETQRRRIIRRYFEEKTLGEIAREEGVLITTVENILKRALHSMRKILDEAEPVKNGKTCGEGSAAKIAVFCD